MLTLMAFFCKLLKYLIFDEQKIFEISSILRIKNFSKILKYKNLIELNDFKKSYGSHLVLEIPRLKIDKGINWFVGKNGSGKSTLFKAIAGITGFEGSLTFEGCPVNTKAAKLKINYAEAEAQYPDFISGKDILEFINSAKGGSEIGLNELVEVFQIKDYWNQKISSYSSGMLKKISLISGFVGKPELIILDEPFILIDKKAIETLMSLIVGRHNAGVSFLISSHQESEIQSLEIKQVFFVADKTVIAK